MKRRIKYKNIILLIIILIFTTSLIISITNIIKWKIDSNRTKTQIKELVNNVNEINDNSDTEIINQDKNIDKSNQYWDYIKMNLINVNFKELKKINNSVKGWIQVNGTSINYPFVQTDNNSYYLNHSFDKTKNESGWVFLDYRNSINELNKNTILYAHGRMDKTMFGSLKNIIKSKWFNNKNNYIVKLSTETENTLWQVFSVYKIPTTSDYLQIYFNGDKEFIQLANTLLNRSVFNFNTSINKEDYILTLSTCYNENEKVVMHAKLIKKQIK